MGNLEDFHEIVTVYDGHGSNRQVICTGYIIALPDFKNKATIVVKEMKLTGRTTVMTEEGIELSKRTPTRETFFWNIDQLEAHTEEGKVELRRLSAQYRRIGQPIDMPQAKKRRTEQDMSDHDSDDDKNSSEDGMASDGGEDGAADDAAEGAAGRTSVLSDSAADNVAVRAIFHSDSATDDTAARPSVNSDGTADSAANDPAAGTSIRSDGATAGAAGGTRILSDGAADDIAVRPSVRSDGAAGGTSIRSNGVTDDAAARASIYPDCTAGSAADDTIAGTSIRLDGIADDAAGETSVLSEGVAATISRINGFRFISGIAELLATIEGQSREQWIRVDQVDIVRSRLELEKFEMDFFKFVDGMDMPVRQKKDRTLDGVVRLRNTFTVHGGNVSRMTVTCTPSLRRLKEIYTTFVKNV